MRRICIACLLILGIINVNKAIFAQQIFTPNKVCMLGPIPVEEPVMLDSVDINEKNLPMNLCWLSQWRCRPSIVFRWN